MSALSFAQTLYDNTIKKAPTFIGFQDDEKWDNNSTCSILAPGNAVYQVSAASPGQYVRCMATATHFENFAYQVAMSIEGDAGGVIFVPTLRTIHFFASLLVTIQLRLILMDLLYTYVREIVLQKALVKVCH
jgi:hypothetical protein